MSWRVANSLLKLREQVNALAPNRAKGWDGTIGDAAHQSRGSDHNPWVRDGGMGVVTAMDITHDPAHGVNSFTMADSLLASKDPRIKYIISNHRIGGNEAFYQRNRDVYSLPAPWKWGRYRGKNPHDHHVHVSVEDKKALYDSTNSWKFTLNKPDPNATPADNKRIIRMGSTGADVGYAQFILKIPVDNVFGPATEAAVKAFQKERGLESDGVVGRMTWDALLIVGK